MNTEKKQSFFRGHRTSILLIASAIIVMSFIFFSPVFSQSTNPCSSCHGGYYQYLDILEGNAANQLPTTLNVGQTATVSVVVQNNVNTASYTALSSVSLTLNSQNGHFTVSVPTFSVGTLQKGTTTATWQITGVSAGPDVLVISASARNSHQNRAFQDTYSPSPAVTVAGPAPTPTPTPVPTPSPTPTPSRTPTPTPAPTPRPTTSPSPSPFQFLPLHQPQHQFQPQLQPPGRQHHQPSPQPPHQHPCQQSPQLLR